MERSYLEFEKPIEEIKKQISQTLEIGDKGQVGIKETLKELEIKLSKITREIFDNLSPWQKVQLSRHPDRPYTLDYVNAITDGNFLELHGDRNIKDDKAMIGGLGKIGDQTFMFIGQQKGYNTKTRQYRNFGMSNPEGYRKALRLMKSAEKFNIPVITLIDTPGAYPGLGAEQRGQASAIANSIECCMSLTVPNISIIIGEGGSGGAIALASSNKVIMLENSIYSVISPEGCASILWRDPSKSLQAADAMKLTAKDLLDFNIIDEIIEEPLGGAHRDPDSIALDIKFSIVKNLKFFENFSEEEILFQNEVQAFLEKELTEDLVSAAKSTSAVFTEKDIAMEWQYKLAKKGWLVPSWPEEYGGTNWTHTQKYIFSSGSLHINLPDFAQLK